MKSNKKILIIDDDNFLLDMYSLKFSKYDFSVTAAAGPDVALETLRSGLLPDVILLDIVMPVMDGFELMEKMKEENLATDAIKIVLSNRGQPSDIARGEALGASGYIVKASSTPSEVIEKVQSIINEKNKTKNGL
ncbi:MAG: putative response regulator protein phoB [Candidatus Nomurabacteria bacterium GW2011_GWF2_35_66]|uniref:Putative response regulator protein phoB n=1 Tax=Candidatus Nomurabacteria bacterium GW2011_GWE1_35_16 TaxID=1618761 RepID=A0A0G0EHQ1_9BACT|nr:MAG: putative response regulator protein phoB [Candidatus Nomurabacteria bacterium GW2011_GWF1_34_20]KKP63605.1 MAG: putative response regulator protein phoB [Candidatus Nomurabacteria bacterium GW2011_GWE2_34_25]KKP66807.1 MAG: putative response regulator protein phoB [Candidatus Nomurabacteria bacterium GW2011_GWE1_35_16]KKP83433.1 MAG: putative response regulator protein phoB [Candidatus Nomurabacteria bacterium GW2011_GWF2_35_66]HAE36635.1 response regulator [Candidatus Nomurabacteria ba